MLADEFEHDTDVIEKRDRQEGAHEERRPRIPILCRAAQYRNPAHEPQPTPRRDGFRLTQQPPGSFAVKQCTRKPYSRRFRSQTGWTSGVLIVSNRTCLLMRCALP